MKGNIFMNRTIYDIAFNILETQSSICDKLESVGLRFEYGSGFVGESLESLINDAENIILESLGLHEVSVDSKMLIAGDLWPATIEVLRPEDNNSEWSITMEDFYEFFYQAIKNPTIRDLMWKAMVDKDQDAKNKYNDLKCGRIGYQ
jgi:hypothetical protein